MRGDRLYKRSVTVLYGDQSVDSRPTVPFTLENDDDTGLRVAFDFRRTNTGEPDQGQLRLWNLPEQVRNGLKADLESQYTLQRDVQTNTRDPTTRAQRLKSISDDYRISVFAGYGSMQPTLVFRGDMIDVKPAARRGREDTITEITLGDTLLSLRHGYLRRAFGTGSTIQNVMRAAAAAANLGLDPYGESIISAVAPNATITKVKNGLMARGRVGDTLDELADLFGVQWWVREGTLYFVPQGSTLSDYSIELQQGRDLLDYVEAEAYEDVQARALLNPGIVPGRGMILRDEDGRRLDRLGFRVNRTHVRGDTGGAAWWVDFWASPVSSQIIAPSAEFLATEFVDSVP